MPPTTRRSAGVPAATPVPHDTCLAHAVDRPTLAEFRLGVEYPQPMHRMSDNTVRVFLEPTSPIHEFLDIHRTTSPEPLLARLIVPGAIVTPGEAMLQPSASRAVETVFHVTPVAHGTLPSHVELHRGSGIELVEFHVRSRGRGLPWMLAILTFLVPAVLHALAQSGASLPAWIERQVLAWLPPGAAAESSARQVSHLAERSAKTVRDARLSFLTFLGLFLTTICLFLMRRPTPTWAWGEAFSLHPPSGPKPQPTPNYFTPVSIPEVNPFA